MKTITDITARRADLLAALRRYDRGDGCLGVTIDAALAANPDVTADEVADGLDEAEEDARIEREADVETDRHCYCHGCGDSISAANATWHNGDAYCAGCEEAPSSDEAHGYTFEAWLAAAGRTDSASEYDLRAAWRAGESPEEYRR